MEKNEVLKVLKEHEKAGKHLYAEVVVDVYATNGGLVYPDEKIIVLLKKDCITPYAFIGKCFTCCDNVADFEYNTIWGDKEARKAYCRYNFQNARQIIFNK